MLFLIFLLPSLAEALDTVLDTTSTVTAVAPTLTDYKILIRKTVQKSDEKINANDVNSALHDVIIEPTLKIDITNQDNVYLEDNYEDSSNKGKNMDSNLPEYDTDTDAKIEEVPEAKENECLKVEVFIDSKIVHNEWIILFKKYYPPQKRKEILIAVLLENTFHILPRKNPAMNFDSDFELIKIDESSSNGIHLLQKSNLIKRVMEQKILTRSLKFVNENKADCNPEPCKADENAFLPSKNRIRRTSRNINSVSGSEFWFGSERYKTRKLLKSVVKPLTAELQANVLWEAGNTGQGVKVAVFDTGLPINHPHFKNVKDRTNWTNEKTLDDGLGHGTFVAGVIASQAECLGFAPDADLHIYRVFTNKQVSYTSWFLDAFNYAIVKNIDVLNLSIGGPDFMDVPFVDKVWEMSANNIIMISAIGNDGPLYGTLNNPADQMDVIGVGGTDFNSQIARFSSRGMTTWELPAGYGRVKPDIVTFGSAVRGSNIKSGCRTLSGTSVASPVVAGAVTLLLSTIEPERRHLVNPAMMKQALMAGARRLENANMFEQGAGTLDLLSSWKMLQEYTPQASLSPPYIDYTDCPYMWPYCSQPLFHSSQPGIHNITILNGLAVTGKIREPPTWNFYQKENGNLLEVSVKYSEVLWPWCGYIAVTVAVNKEGADFEGVASGHVEFTIDSHTNEGELASFTLRLLLRIKITPTPPRHRRILWDQFHNLRYPPGYFPRDNLKEKEDPLDWNGDHIHTNYREMYQYLRNAGYFVEVMGSPFSCFDGSLYGTLLIVDPEDEFFDEEIKKLQNDIMNQGLNLIVFAEWFNTSVMEKVRFFDENTRQWWIPDTGGANVPALNELLSNFGIEFGSFVAEGKFMLGAHAMYYGSGTIIRSFPDNGRVVIQNLFDQGGQVLKQNGESSNSRIPSFDKVAILGLTEKFSERSGRIGVYGDSNCLDSAHMKKDCYWLLEQMISDLRHGSFFLEEYVPWSDTNIHIGEVPLRMKGNHLHRWSRVLKDSLVFEKRTISPCPTSTWVTPKPVNETLVPQTWKHRPLLAIDLENNIKNSLPINIDDSAISLRSWLFIVVLSFIMIIFLCIQYRRPGGAKERRNRSKRPKRRNKVLT